MTNIPMTQMPGPASRLRRDGSCARRLALTLQNWKWRPVQARMMPKTVSPASGSRRPSCSQTSHRSPGTRAWTTSTGMTSHQRRPGTNPVSPRPGPGLPGSHPNSRVPSSPGPRSSRPNSRAPSSPGPRSSRPTSPAQGSPGPRSSRPNSPAQGSPGPASSRPGRPHPRPPGLPRTRGAPIAKPPRLTGGPAHRRPGAPACPLSRWSARPVRCGVRQAVQASSRDVPARRPARGRGR